MVLSMVGSALAPILGSVLASGVSIPHAYLDPGSGSYLLQLLIAGALGGLVALRLYWSRIVAFFRRRNGEPTKEKDELED